MPNSFVGKGNLGTSPTLKTIRVGNEDRKVAEMRVFFDEYRRCGKMARTKLGIRKKENSKVEI